MFAEFHFEVIKAEAEQSLLCRKKELKKENSPVEKFRKQLFQGYGVWPGFQLRVQTRRVRQVRQDEKNSTLELNSIEILLCHSLAQGDKSANLCE